MRDAHKALRAITSLLLWSTVWVHVPPPTPHPHVCTSILVQLHTHFRITLWRPPSIQHPYCSLHVFSHRCAGSAPQSNHDPTYCISGKLRAWRTEARWEAAHFQGCKWCFKTREVEDGRDAKNGTAHTLLFKTEISECRAPPRGGMFTCAWKSQGPFNLNMQQLKMEFIVSFQPN